MVSERSSYSLSLSHTNSKRLIKIMDNSFLSSHRSHSTIWFDGRNIGRRNGTGVQYYAINHSNVTRELGYSTAWLLENVEGYSSLSIASRIIAALLSRAPTISNMFQSVWGDAFLANDLYRVAHLHYRYHKRLLRLTPLSPPDIMHWTYPLPLFMEGCQNVVTIHDIIPLTHPSLTGIDPTRFRRILSSLIESPVHFVAVSETVRNQIINLLSVHPDRITTLYQPVEFSKQVRNSISNAPRIAPADSFVFYGRIEHRKNIERLLEAHALSGTKTPLILIGPDGDDRPNYKPYGSSSQVIRLPWSNRFSLLRTLQESKALLFPSLAEGFGLPIIEAMSLGVPVLTSRGGVTEEISGNAAMLCDATNIVEMANCINILDQLSENDKKRMIKAGLERAKFFSSNLYKRNISSFYEKIKSYPSNTIL